MERVKSGPINTWHRSYRDGHKYGNQITREQSTDCAMAVPGQIIRKENNNNNKTGASWRKKTLQ